MDKKKIEQAVKMYNTKEFTLAEIEKACKVSRATIYRNLK